MQNRQHKLISACISIHPNPIFFLYIQCWKCFHQKNFFFITVKKLWIEQFNKFKVSDCFNSLLNGTITSTKMFFGVLNCLYVFYKSLPYEQDFVLYQGQVLNKEELVWFWSLPFPGLVAVLRVKNPVCPTIKS